MNSLIGKSYNMIDVWREKATKPPDVCGLPCGHFLPEEAPELTYQAMMKFFSDQACLD